MGNLSFRAPLEEYEGEAELLFQALDSGDGAAEWRFKWEHPRFRGMTIDAVKAAALGLADAQLVIAQEYSFDTWADLAAFSEAVESDGPVVRFENAVEALVAGDAATLQSTLRETPELVRARSIRRHHATLLHYLGANGVE